MLSLLRCAHRIGFRQSGLVSGDCSGVKKLLPGSEMEGLAWAWVGVDEMNVLPGTKLLFCKTLQFCYDEALEQFYSIPLVSVALQRHWRMLIIC